MKYLRYRGYNCELADGVERSKSPWRQWQRLWPSDRKERRRDAAETTVRMHVSQSQQKTLRADYYFRGTRARAHKSERRRFTRGHRASHVAILSCSLQSEIFPKKCRLFSIFVPFTTVSYNVAPVNSLQSFRSVCLFDSNLA